MNDRSVTCEQEENRTMNQDRQPAGVPAGGQFAASAHAEAAVALTDPAETSRVTFTWTQDGTGSWSGTSTDGWGSRATIVPPEEGNGEDFYWEVRQNGWTWDGNEPDLATAQEAARSEANRMLAAQEAEGIDWDADDDYDDDYDDDEADYNFSGWR